MAPHLAQGGENGAEFRAAEASSDPAKQALDMEHIFMLAT